MAVDILRTIKGACGIQIVFTELSLTYWVYDLFSADLERW